MKTESFESVEFERFQQVAVELDDSPLAGRYLTQISSVQSSKLLLRVPMVDRLYLPIPEEKIFTFHCMQLSGNYQCRIKVKKRFESGGFPVFEIPRPAKMKRIQHRKDVRVPCKIDVELWELEPGTEQIKRGPIEATAVDISAGGLKLHTDTEIDSGTEIVMNFDLPLVNEQLETIFGKVLRAFDEKVGDQFVSAVKFNGLPSFQEDIIIKYAYQRQIQLKKQGRWRS